MNQKKELIKILFISFLSFLLGLGIGLIKADEVSEKNQSTNNQMTSETSIQPTEFTVKKGGVYTRQSFVDVNDPFNVPIIDTITVLDLQTSKKSNAFL